MTSLALQPSSMLPDPTAQQRVASDPALSVWVNASAGSGKTTILTNRVTRLLLTGVRPEKILCLTFTRAAAAEMALRISDKLSQWAVCSDNDLNASLGDLQGYAPTPQQMTLARRLFAETLACPGGMRIRTLHAFGQEILRRFPIESGLPPHFAVIEEDDARALQDDTLTDLLRHAAANPDAPLSKAIATLIETFSEKGFREAAGHVLREKARLQKAIAVHGSLAHLIGALRSALDLAPDDTMHSLQQSLFAALHFPENEVRAAAKLLLQGTPSFAKRGTAILQWLEQEAAQRLGNLNSYQRCFLKADGDCFEKYGDKALLASQPDLDRILRREAQRLKNFTERCAAVHTAETTSAALIFGTALIEGYSRRKAQQAALDYDDLVYQTLALLQRPGIAPWVLHKLDDGLDHLLVDEAQDTSRAQWDIVATLADEFFAGSTAKTSNRTLFVVGDEKQSIYSFQNADPEAFAAMRGFFKAKIMAAEKRCEEIPLHVSFRSAPAVLRAVDAVFADPLAAEGVSAVPVEHFSYKHKTLFGRVELWPLLPQPDTASEAELPWSLPIGYEKERDPQAELAERIAALIKGWIRQGEMLPGTDRPIRPGDIMILLRKRGRFADLMVRALKQKPQDVPVTGVDRMRLLQQLPVMDLLAVIQFVLLPEDDLNLATVLRGPLLKISEDDLMQIAMRRGTMTLWQSLKNASGEHAQSATAYLTRWLGQADFMTPFAMLTALLTEPCPASATSGRHALWMRLGLDALDPIDELLNAAQNFSRHHTPSLQSFLHWLGASDREIKRELDHAHKGDAGQVRIMTVHAAKGLEAPIVFLPDTANVPRVQDVPKFLWDEQQHLPFYIAAKPESGLTRRLWDQARAKQMQEYRRLLYVAMTRASHRLYIGGWELKKKEADGEGCWHALIKNGLKESETGIKAAAAGVVVWEDPSLPNQPAAARNLIATEDHPLPAWALQSAPAEPAARRPASPSKLATLPSAATPDHAFARGRIIHRLLQSLPEVARERREAAAQRFLAHPQHALSNKDQAEILGEVLKLFDLSAYAPFFGMDSRAEVPLAGFVNGEPVTGQVDRLTLHENEVWILDYKTNRPPPADARDIPEAYRSQMAAYRDVLQVIYPQRIIRCFLLWTYAPALMEIPFPQG